MTDTATLTGGQNPTGTITFRLYGPGDTTCTGTAVHTDTETVAGNGSYTSTAHTPTALGTYRWIAVYSGDTNNTPVTGACNDAGESAVITQVTPTLTTNASPGGPLGTTLTDTATLTGGQNPTGTITFRLYGPGDTTCTGTAVHTDTETVAGNGSYTSTAHTPTALGTYRWIAVYSGDTNNTPVTGACNDAGESAVITPDPPGPPGPPGPPVPPGARADLSITIVDAVDPVAVHDTISYTVTVTNAGPADATGIKIIDVLPAGVTFVSASAGCSAASETVTCSVGALSSGATSSATIVVKADVSGLISNTARVDGGQADPETANDAATETTTVLGRTPPPPPLRPTCQGITATIVADGSRIVGTPGRDVIIGTKGADKIIGARGRDLICGRGGADVIRGGRGADELFGGAGPDSLFGGRGNDNCRGGSGRDRVSC